MNIQFLKQPDKAVFFLLIYALILLIPAYFIHLGMMPFILDESTRAIVALEMIHNDNYIIPTINGEFYYNKPPLFNWILIAFVKLTGSQSEFIFRLPVVLSLFFFALTIYLTQRKELGKKVAFFSAIALLTCGRILIYDSMKGLLDINFSWLIYLMIWLIWYYSKKEKWYHLFIFVWIITTLAFLMKGLPALVFLGISLVTWFLAIKDIRRLFKLPNILGFLVFLVLVGAYFYAYHRSNNLENFFSALYSESAKRTFLENPLWKNIKHFITFPFEFIYHFLPWSIFVLSLFSAERIKIIRTNPFTRFLSLMFLGNIIIYWLSPAIYARYLFMFVPLLSGVVFYAYIKAENEIFTERYIVKPALVLFMFTIVILISLSPWFADISIYKFFWLKYGILLVLGFIPMVLFMRHKLNLILPLFVLLLVMRLAFNLYILPDRLQSGRDDYQKRGAITAGELTRGREVYLLEDTRIKHISTFYFMVANGNPLKRWKEAPVPGKVYIIEKAKASLYPAHKTLFIFETEVYGIKLALVEFFDEEDSN